MLENEHVYIATTFGKAQKPSRKGAGGKEVRDVLSEGKELRYVLAKRGITAYMDMSGDLYNMNENAEKSSALSHCKLAVILATETYGENTVGVGFPSETELKLIIDDEIPYVLVKMCDDFAETATAKALSGKAFTWMPWTTMPVGLVDDIANRLETLGVIDEGEPPVTSVQQKPSVFASCLRSVFGIDTLRAREEARKVQAVTKVLQGMRVDDPSAAMALVKYGACSAEDISKLDKVAIDELKHSYDLLPRTAQKMWKHILEEGPLPPSTSATFKANQHSFFLPFLLSPSQNLILLACLLLCLHIP
eukprot:1319757-Rhodomonas_salina.1